MEQSSPSLNLTLWPSEERIFSCRNIELPQQTTHPSSWGELLGWGWHGDTETAGTMGAQEAPTGAGSRLIQVQQLDPEDRYPTTAVDIFLCFRVAWGRTRLGWRQLVPRMMEPLVSLPLWIWAALMRFPCSCHTQTHTPKSPNRPRSVCPRLLCCGASADKRLHGNFKGDSSMHTTPNPSRHTEDALKQLVGPWWPQVCAVARVCASLCKQTAPGHGALAVRTHSVLTAVPLPTWQPGGLQRTPAEGSLWFPKKKAPFF